MRLLFGYTTDKDRFGNQNICIYFNDSAAIWSNNCNSHHYYKAMNLYNSIIRKSVIMPMVSIDWYYNDATYIYKNVIINTLYNINMYNTCAHSSNPNSRFVKTKLHC